VVGSFGSSFFLQAVNVIDTANNNAKIIAVNLFIINSSLIIITIFSHFNNLFLFIALINPPFFIKTVGNCRKAKNVV